MDNSRAAACDVTKGRETGWEGCGGPGEEGEMVRGTKGGKDNVDVGKMRKEMRKERQKKGKDMGTVERVYEKEGEGERKETREGG